MNLRYSGIFLIIFSALLISCGGGGGDSKPGTSPSITIPSSSPVSSFNSSSSSSKPAVSAVIAPDNQVFTLDEDNALDGEIKLNVGYVNASSENESVGSVIHTRNGGIVRLSSGDISLPKALFNYKPADDFNGEDDCDVYLTKTSEYGAVQRQKIKIVFHVKSVVDENLKFDITNKKVFVEGDSVQLSLPYQPDTRVSVSADLDFKLSIDGVPVSHSVNANGLNFIMPEHHLAGAKTLNVGFEYQGKSIALTRNLLSKIDYGDVEYWMGDKGRPGATYVVITEPRVDLQKHLDWINTQFTNFLNTPIVAQYNNYWNLVVIKKPAPENYAYVENENVSAILFGDLKESGYAFVKGFVPNYDGIILNTNLEGRATGGYLMVVNSPHINILLHEFGHLHAKLGDEYADTSYPRAAIYMEGLNPNITNFNDYESIPWKHWILDKTNIPGVNAGAGQMGVGAFLGANYKDNQFYRPMFSTIMGTDIFAPMGPIYLEAWALGSYERVGILGSITTTKNASSRTLNVTKEWNKNLTRLDWFLNGSKQDAWTNQSIIVVDENTITENSYSITAELTDLSGYIKDPHAYSGFKWFNHDIPFESLGRIDSLDSLKNVMNENFQKQWTFDKTITTPNFKLQKSANQSDLQTATANNDWVSHDIVIENGVHQLVSSACYELQDTLLEPTPRSDFRADVVDAQGSPMYVIGIDNPYRHYHDAGRLVLLKEQGRYKIKHPHINGSYQIIIIDQRTHQRVAVLNFAQ